MAISHSEVGLRQISLIHPTDFQEEFDPTRDSPVELLHTILLGIVKYAWHASHTQWRPTTKSKFAIRLHSLDWNSISAHSVRPEYIIQYANSLVGLQLKTIVQSFVFAAHNLVSSDLFSVWKAIGELTALLWMPEIVDPMQHQVRSYPKYGLFCNKSDSSTRVTSRLQLRTFSIRSH